MLHNALTVFSNIGNNIKLLGLNYQYNTRDSKREKLNDSINVLINSKCATELEVKAKIDKADQVRRKLNDECNDIDKKRKHIKEKIALNDISILSI